MLTPRPRPPPPARRREWGRTGTGAGAGAAVAALAGGGGEIGRLLDLGHRTGRRIEERLAHRRPAAERLDREQLRRRRELAGELRQHRRVDRAVALLGPERLGLRGPQP